jgi:hypothetical protein
VARDLYRDVYVFPVGTIARVSIISVDISICAYALRPNIHDFGLLLVRIELYRESY